MRSFLHLFLVSFFLIGLYGCGEQKQKAEDGTRPTGKKHLIEPGEGVAEALQEALIKAKPGDTVLIRAGVYKLTTSLSIDGIAYLTVMGEGMDKTILNFAGQQAGAEGLIAKADDLTIRDLAIEDAAGDALKVQDSKNLSLLNVRTEWTNGPDSSNGAYGLYPVTCENVLMDSCVAIAASDAGIYVGQSKNVIVRNCRAHKNVAGIEIENTTNADVYNNIATENTGGICVFDLPDVPVKDGSHVRVYDNVANNNNTFNFAPAGNTVSQIPPGTGMFIMAYTDVEVFDNEIKGNNTISMAIISYRIISELSDQFELKDSLYNPYCAAIYMHNNVIEPGEGPRDTETAMGQAVASLFNRDNMGPLMDQLPANGNPHIIYDGIVDPQLLMMKSVPDDRRICVQDNGEVMIANLDAMNDFENLKVGPNLLNCSLEQLSPTYLAIDPTDRQAQETGASETEEQPAS